ncbi:helix-turn-helix domain-containing protein [Cellulomonas triticagri]|uniref:RNA polymerase subunit sigma-70 n=1 Tax=Cellulomonas triticagri TaxID=2483352 RepID=A0A3M2JCL5_9CELL|nr:helix-turn-helix domain-containing protein [Cellulomonas triticagri]RMI09620.1 RNA polymerase subunit sigma-70 [Cellulomonas triticagri]
MTTPAPQDDPAPTPEGALAGAVADDPAVGLRAVRSLRVLADRLEALQVGRARELGWSWQDVADALGVSRQAVHQKHHRRTT